MKYVFNLPYFKYLLIFKQHFLTRLSSDAMLRILSDIRRDTVQSLTRHSSLSSCHLNVSFLLCHILTWNRFYHTDQAGLLIETDPSKNSVLLLIDMFLFEPSLRIRIHNIFHGSGCGSIIFSMDPDPDPNQKLAHFHHLSPPPSHLIFHPSSFTPTPSSIIPHPSPPFQFSFTPPHSPILLQPLNYSEYSPSYLIRLPSSLNTAHSPFLPHP